MKEFLINNLSAFFYIDTGLTFISIYIVIDAFKSGNQIKFPEILVVILTILLGITILITALFL